MLLLAAEAAGRRTDFAGAEASINAATAAAAITTAPDPTALMFRQSAANCIEARGDLFILQSRPAVHLYEQALERWTQIKTASPELDEAASRLSSLTTKMDRASKSTLQPAK